MLLPAPYRSYCSRCYSNCLCSLTISIQFITQFQYLLLNIIMNEIFSGNLECNYTRGEPLRVAMLFIIPWPIGISCMLILIITEHPAYSYSAIDVARCRDGDVSRVSLKYDAAECSPGLLSMEWYPSLMVPGRRRMFTLVGEHGMVATPPCSWSFSITWFFHAGTRDLQRHMAPSLHHFLFLWKMFLLPFILCEHKNENGLHNS